MDGTGVIEYSEFLAATIEAHGGISEERLAEAFDRIDCDDSGYITVDNLADMLGTDVPKEYLESIIDEADIVRDHRISYEEFLALWDEGEDVKREQTLEDVKRRRLLHNPDSVVSGVSSTNPSSYSLSEHGSEISTNDSDSVHKSDRVHISGGFLFRQEKGKSIRRFADI